MDFYPVAIEKLIEEFAKLPSIGQKTAQRLTLHILNNYFIYIIKRILFRSFYERHI